MKVELFDLGARIWILNDPYGCIVHMDGSPVARDGINIQRYHDGEREWYEWIPAPGPGPAK